METKRSLTFEEKNALHHVAFMTRTERASAKVFNRFVRTKQQVNGPPHMGPGTYEIDDKTKLANKLDYMHSISSKGYTLGARTGPRFAPSQRFKTPGPTAYRTAYHQPHVFEAAGKPFEVGSDRFPAYKRECVPGAGTYEHDVKTSRRVQYPQAFGKRPAKLPGISVRSSIDQNTKKLYTTTKEKKYHRKLAYLKLYF